jgi:hypothetical protein
MRVREDAVERADGSAGVYGVVEKPTAALVIAAERGGFWLVEQFRHPLGRRSWEFVQGTWPAGGGGTAGSTSPPGSPRSRPTSGWPTT